MLSGCSLLLPDRVDEVSASHETSIGGEDQLVTDAPPLKDYLDWQQDALETLSGEAGDDRAPPADMWERIRRGMAMEPAENPRITPHLQWYVRHAAYLDRVTDRAAPYLHYILDQIEERGLPTELALLPIVESAYDPFAYSHGRAAGLWQFIPGTGRRFGLKQNWWYDGRRDVVESTRAALDYMEYLSERFGGDWELALASYNAGQGNVARSIRRNEQRGEPTDYWHLQLPRETMGYVPKMHALRMLVADPEQYGVALRPLPNEPYLAVVELDGQIDLALAAELAGIGLDDLYRLNPGFNRWATDPDGPHRLLVPLEHQAELEEGLAALSPEDKIQWQRHRIAAGESLNLIARRYNTTVRLLQDVNNLNGHIIRAGEHILVPQARGSAAAYSGSEGQRLARLQERPREGRERINHTVSAGESFWSISRRYGVDTRELAQWNGLAPGDTLQAGRTLAVWVPAGSERAMSARVGSGPSDTQRRVTYQVRRGDNLSRIAGRFGVSVGDLVRWNNLSPDTYLQPGQRLTVIVDITAVSGS
jgi:membrane-bound lytic murein transglycosylase D